MAQKKGNGKTGKEKFLKKYRLIILNDDTFEEKINFKVNRLNVLIIIGVSAFLTILFTVLLIAFTPLKEYIPGYASTKLRRQAATLYYKTDSLETVIERNNLYYESIRKVLLGDTIENTMAGDSLITEKPAASEVNFAASKADSLLRKEVEQKEKYSVQGSANNALQFKLFPPAKGKITDTLNTRIRHFGVDVSLTDKTPIKAIAEGTVIFAEWSADTGFVIIIEHSFGFISVYKHNSSLTKEQGEMVKAGEVIAMSGNTGSFSTGPHLHFEIWSDGIPINPIDFIEFE